MLRRQGIRLPAMLAVIATTAVAPALARVGPHRWVRESQRQGKRPHCFTAWHPAARPLLGNPWPSRNFLREDHIGSRGRTLLKCDSTRR